MIIGDPISELVYDKNDLSYMYSKHPDDVKNIVDLMVKIFRAAENIIKVAEHNKDKLSF